MEVKAPLAYVRLDGGDGTTKLLQGDTVPDGLDDVHVAQLVSRGVLGDPEPTPEPTPPKGRRAGGQSQGD